MSLHYQETPGRTTVGIVLSLNAYLVLTQVLHHASSIDLFTCLWASPPIWNISTITGWIVMKFSTDICSAQRTNLNTQILIHPPPPYSISPMSAWSIYGTNMLDTLDASLFALLQKLLKVIPCLQPLLEVYSVSLGTLYWSYYVLSINPAKMKTSSGQLSTLALDNQNKSVLFNCKLKSPSLLYSDLPSDVFDENRWVWRVELDRKSKNPGTNCGQTTSKVVLWRAACSLKYCVICWSVYVCLLHLPRICFLISLEGSNQFW